jgi:zinc/manganese transport system substrate-binding protein
MRTTTGLVVAIAAALVVAGVGAYLVLTSASPSACNGVDLGLPATSVTAPPHPTGNAHPSSTKTFPGPGNREPSRDVAHGESSPTYSPSHPIQVVAAENFWGSLVSQLGGSLTHVISIISDPNTDPHEYESNTTDSLEITNANYIIVNGVGYDTWASDEIAADGETNQTVLNVGTLNGVVEGGNVVTGNPHMWYSPTYVNHTVAAMYADLVAIDPANVSVFQANYATLNLSLDALYDQAYQIKHYHAGAVVAATEDIFVYLANYTGLDLISPPEFMQAIAEANDPPAQAVVTFQCQLESGKVLVLVYNEQTVTPITANMKTIAAQNNVTIVGITETIQPPSDTFQQWMGAQYGYLQNALNASSLGK